MPLKITQDGYFPPTFYIISWYKKRNHCTVGDYISKSLDRITGRKIMLENIASSSKYHHFIT